MDNFIAGEFSVKEGTPPAVETNDGLLRRAVRRRQDVEGFVVVFPGEARRMCRPQPDARSASPAKTC